MFETQGVVMQATLSGSQRVRPQVLVLAVFASAGAVLFAGVVSWPLWAVVAAGAVPWVPVFWSETAWTKRHYGWLALFYVLAITQTGHMLEHTVQMLQLRVLHEAPAHAKGVFGALDIEWVHFVWNTWVLVALGLLTFRFRENTWLLFTFLFALFHEAEHITVFSVYLRTGIAGDPGLLAQGGRIAGGLAIKRPDLHFFYNLIETVPLLAAFFVQRGRLRSVT